MTKRVPGCGKRVRLIGKGLNYVRKGLEGSGCGKISEQRQKRSCLGLFFCWFFQKKKKLVMFMEGI